MALTIPDIQSGPTFDGQSVPDATDWAAQSGTENGTGVITGGLVSPSSGLTVAVAACTYMIAGVIYTYAGGTVAFGAASTTDRRDIVTINAAGALTVTAGTACGTAAWTRTSTGLPPVKPAIPAGGCLLGEGYLEGSNVTGTTTMASGNLIDKTAPVNGTPGSLLARKQYAPSSATTYTLVSIATGVTALDATNLSVTFVAPPSGDVLVRLTALAQGDNVVGDKVLFAVVSSTSSPGTLVGVVGLVYTSVVTAAATDDEGLVTMEQVITGLSPGTSYTWYFAGAYVTAAGKVIVQGGASNTTTPTGAPAVMSVFAA